MIGYHYTSFKNWQKIKEEGLKGQSIEGDFTLESLSHKLDWSSIKTLLRKEGNGIFVWTEDLSDIVEKGLVVMIMSKFNANKIVKLKIKFSKKDIFKEEGNIVDFCSDFVIGNEGEMKRSFCASFILGDIPLKNIELDSIHSFKKVKVK